jgi:general secretion pathway protein B
LVSEKVSPAPSAAPPRLAELGDDRRRQIPTLNITGAVYSEVPAQRMLLVNGLVLKQGDSAAPDLIVEEIGASASVFSYRGERFRVAH